MSKQNIDFYHALSMEEARVFIYADKKNMTYSARWGAYLPEIVQIIRDYAAAGNYPYNREIEKLTQARLFPEIPETDTEEMLSNIVYNSQCYKGAEDLEAQNKDIEAQGFSIADPVRLVDFIGKKFEVILKGENSLGWNITKTKKLILKSWGEQGLHWMDTRAKRSGYKVTAEQYIRALE